jgi:hypothetical protein
MDVVTASVEFRAEINETTVAQEVVIANYGPGPLAPADSDGTDLGSGFRLVSVSPRPIGANQRAIAAVEFTAPATPGSSTTSHDFGSDDPAAGQIAGHNNRVSLTATVRPIDPIAWGAGLVFAPELGQVDAVAMIQSNFGSGNFEVVARVGDRLHHYRFEVVVPHAGGGILHRTRFAR